jgi:hypothetical protein
MAAVMDELSSLFEAHISDTPSTDVAGSVSGDLTA